MSRVLAALAVAIALATPSAAEWTSGGGAEVPLEGNGTSWTVRAAVNGRFTGQFLLDTGASICVIGPVAARRLDLTPTGQEVTLNTANGVVHAPLVRIDTLDIGGHRVHDVDAVVAPAAPSPLAGLIGLSYLNNFQYSIDAKRRVLRFR